MQVNKYKTIDILGFGAFSTVQKVICLSNNKQYALKRVKYAQLKQKSKQYAINQINILSSIKHGNIIAYRQAYFQQNIGDLCIVMELATGGDLAYRIKQKIQNNLYFRQHEVWEIGYHILKGLQALHSKNIVHRDVKPANIFFTGQNIAKIGDLNVSVSLTDNILCTQTGTPYYASPQVWNRQQYGYQCDIWSFGCVIYQMCALNKAFQGKNIQRLYNRIKQLKYKKIPQRFSLDMINVIEKCLIYKNNRISLQELKKLFQRHVSGQYLSIQKKKFSYDNQTSGFVDLMNKYNIKYNTNKSIDIKMDIDINNPQSLNKGYDIGENNKYSALDKYLKPQRKLVSNHIKSLKNLQINSKIPQDKNYGRVTVYGQIKSPLQFAQMNKIQSEHQNHNLKKLRTRLYTNYLNY